MEDRDRNAIAYAAGAASRTEPTTRAERDQVVVAEQVRARFATEDPRARGRARSRARSRDGADGRPRGRA